MQNIYNKSTSVEYHMKHIPVALAKFDCDMRYVDHSQKWLSISHLPQDADLRGQSHYEIFPEISELWKTVHRRALAGKTIKAQEDPFERIDGSIQYVDWECRPWYNDSGSIGGITIWTNDVSSLVKERLKATSDLLLSEEKFKAAFDQNIFGFGIIDPQGIALDVNESICRILGYSKEEIVGNHFSKFNNTKDLNNQNHQLQQLFKGEIKNLVIEGRYLHKNGTEIHTRKGITAVNNPDGSIKFLLITIQDISAQKISEQALTQSESKFKSFFENAPDAVFVVDLKTRTFIDCNKAAQTILKASKEQITGRFTYDFAPTYQPDGSSTKTKINRSCIELLKYQRPNLETEILCRRLDGEEFYVSMTMNLLSENSMIINWRDITSKKEAQQKMDDYQKQLEKFKITLDNTHDCVFMFDSEHLQFTYINQGAENQVGYTQEELLQMHPFDIKPEFNEKEFRDIIAPLLDGSVSHLRFETTHERKDKRIIPVEVFLQYIENENKPYFLNIVTDITLRKESENQLKQYSRQLEDYQQVLEQKVNERTLLLELKQHELKKQNTDLKKTNNELDHFVYSISHDLRAPLTSIMGLISIMEQDHSSNSDLLQQIEMIKSRINRLDKFIWEILDYSRNKRLELSLDEINFDVIYKNVIEKLDYLPNKENVQINLKVSKNAAFIQDQKRLEILFSNLITNAIKYADLTKAAQFVDVKVLADNKNAIIKIKDNGIGIEEQYQNRIFEMFYRASKHSEGSGLGLYIVQETVLKMGGSITFESEFNQGTEFTIELPNMQQS